ncbi:valine--tRNA ligase [Candidatus Phytoplasma sp. AldY-WA1]|uniref:valine--tRNA ligase n=1 Tax=Candidatus Phytoplasma sp. AldY-WA1 TaxID=2852100 RepID=UPI00254E475B|nr:valine--tRNA ligase [Candidatus Phytoplasma sp. AldY-WA1]
MKAKYSFQTIEKERYQKWLNKDYFRTENNLKKQVFTIVIPPPNITGKLHLGHAWNNTLQDILVRRKKMLGYDILFLPGMDHAGIATQNKIKQKLREEGFLDQNLTKEIFLKYASLWKEDYSKIIREQWASLGLFLDYKYEKFTLDSPLTKTVEKVFIKLYKDNLIYRDYKIINWDPVIKTTLSNIEVNYREIQGKLFYLKYFLFNDSNLFLEVATTRPETIFADQALAVNPEDSRYCDWIGKKVLIPFTNRVISVITDDSVDMEFGTGVVKITPAHDENDFRIGKKNNLKSILCINENGTMNEIAEKYQNLSILECRQKLINDLEKINLLSMIKEHKHMVGFSSISGSMIEPRLSLQWFLKMKELSSFVLKQHNINFFPQRFLKIFNNWLLNVEDWCISRQLWWGHSIPVWYKNEEIKVQVEDPGNGFVQETDVLDTWFSSSLWPLNTLGWDQENNDFFERRFPVDVLVTGYDILTFWVTKMVIQSFYLTKKKPFKNVLLHGLVRDSKGQKMSKSKGNGIEPREIIDKYGTDVLRWFLTTNVSNGSDLCYDENKIINNWKFINKIWNISRLIKLNLQTLETDFNEELLLFPEKALLTHFSKLIKKIDSLYERYEFHIIGELLYHFIWEEFGNFFLEFLKVFLKKEKEYLNTQKFLLFILKNILKLLHPFIPFVTDAIYEDLTLGKSIVHSSWPKIDYSDLKSLDDIQSLKTLIMQFRNWRHLRKINKNNLFTLYIETLSEKNKELKIFSSVLETFFQVNKVKIINSLDENYVCLFSEKNISIWIDKKNWQKINNTAIKDNLKQQKEMLLKEIKRSEEILGNNSFIEKANPNKIKLEREKYQKYLNKYQKLNKNDTI